MGCQECKLRCCKITHSTFPYCSASFDRVLKGLQQWSDLKNWEPNDYDELKNLASKIYDSFCTTAAAQKALAANDAWSAQDIFFIRDALLFCYFEQSVAWADPERVLRVMRYWC